MSKNEPSKNKDATRVAPCTCSHLYQDRQYGAGLRVQNACEEGYRCTVCKKESL